MTTKWYNIQINQALNMHKNTLLKMQSTVLYTLTKISRIKNNSHTPILLKNSFNP